MKSSRVSSKAESAFVTRLLPLSRWAQSLALLLIAASPFVVYHGSTSGQALQASPEPAAPIVIASEVLGHATPITVEDPELALGRVTIMPGAAIPLHHHPGTQIGVVVQGTLTYVVESGTVELLRADQPESGPHLLAPGETIQVEIGDALIESPGAVHQGRNEGTTPVVIYLSTLFPADAPRSITDAATPTP